MKANLRIFLPLKIAAILLIIGGVLIAGSGAETPPERLYKITGGVMDAAPDISDASLAKMLSAKSVDEEIAEFHKILSAQPIPNVVVVLKSDTVSQKTRSDAEGKFEFPQLPNGYYEISCEHPTERSGEKCVATAKTRIEIRDYNPHAWLNLRSDRVVIKGRITGNQGNPVAGAKVIGKLANLPYNPQIGNPPEEYVPPTFTTLSSADGSYVLEGFDPTEILAVAKYLAHAHPEYLRYAEMRVEHPGLTQDATRITKATLLTEDAIAQARRLMAALNKTAYQKSEGRKLLEEKKGLAFPAMQGGTVTGVDIALDPAK